MSKPKKKSSSRKSSSARAGAAKASAPKPSQAGSAAKKSGSGRKGFQAWWAIVAVVVIVAAVGIYWFTQQGGKASAAQPAEITVAEAYKRYQAGAFLLDVRQPEEWDEFHIPNTTSIPLGDLENHASELPKDQPIIVVCNTGNRSQQGRELLLRLGFTQVTSMAGGVTKWRAAGYPIVSGP